jgi:hypothetical protein
MNSLDRPKWKDRKLGALWVRKTASGEDKFIIRINYNGETINLIGLPNTSKTEKQHPDSTIYRAAEDLIKDNNEQ